MPEKTHFSGIALPKRAPKTPVCDDQATHKSLVAKVFFALCQGSIGTADRRLGIAGGYHPKGAFEIIARVANTRSLNPPNQHGTHTPTETGMKLAVRA